MKVRLNVALSGTRNGHAWPACGETVDLPDSEALGMVAGGLASLVASELEIERAVAPEADVETRKSRTRKPHA